MEVLDRQKLNQRKLRCATSKNKKNYIHNYGNTVLLLLELLLANQVVSLQDIQFSKLTVLNLRGQEV